MNQQDKITAFEPIFNTTLLKVEKKAKSMTLEQLEELASTTGFLTLLDEETEFMDRIQELPRAQQEIFIDTIMQNVYRAYCDKKPQDPEKLQYCMDAVIFLLKALNWEYTVTEHGINFTLFNEEYEVFTIERAAEAIKELSALL